MVGLSRRLSSSYLTTDDQSHILHSRIKFFPKQLNISLCIVFKPSSCISKSLSLHTPCCHACSRAFINRQNIVEGTHVESDNGVDFFRHNRFNSFTRYLPNILQNSNAQRGNKCRLFFLQKKIFHLIKLHLESATLNCKNLSHGFLINLYVLIEVFNLRFLQLFFLILRLFSNLFACAKILI